MVHILPCGAPQHHRSCDTYPCISPYRWCQRWLPSKILVRRVCTRRGLRWGVPLALLGLIHFTAGAGCVGAVQLGGSPWWYLGTVICWWTTLKLVGRPCSGEPGCRSRDPRGEPSRPGGRLDAPGLDPHAPTPTHRGSTRRSARRGSCVRLSTLHAPLGGPTVLQLA